MQVQQESVVGHATFYSNINHLNFILSQTEKNILRNQKWSWEIHCYNIFLWKQIFSKIRRSSCKILQLSKISNFAVIKDIQHIDFTELKILTLDTNNITNVENLQFLNLAKLVRLNLSQNQICELSFFHKQRMLFLQEVLFQINPIKSIESLSRCQINLNKIKRIAIQFFNQDSPFINDLSQMIKYNSRNIGVVRYTEDNRINQQKVKLVLGQKYQSIIITTQNIVILD